VLSFVAAPNFEAATDFTRDNVYDVTVRASDGTTVDTQALAIRVTDVNEAFSITSHGGGDSAAISMAENGYSSFSVFTNDPDPGALTFTLSGADAARFTVTGSGKNANVSFKLTPNYEAPTDANGDNVYELVVTASDGTFSDSQAVAVTVTNVNENVRITSNGGNANAYVTTAENQQAVTSVVATDPDGAPVTYSISGGVDASKFTIDSATGALRFVSAPNFEVKADSGANNVYDVTVRATDGVTSATQAIAVTVSNVFEPFAITSHGGGDTASVAQSENTTSFAMTTNEGGNLTWQISGGADAARFRVVSSAAGGATIGFLVAPNYEAPTDSNGDNVYQLVVTASRGGYSDSQTISVVIGDVNEAVTITSNGAGTSALVSMAENQVAVTTVTAVDPEKKAITYSISGGADASKFAIDAASGALRFLTAPNFEARTDSGLNGVYDVAGGCVTARHRHFSGHRPPRHRAGLLLHCRPSDWLPAGPSFVVDMSPDGLSRRVASG
jgi:hypothetical protein